MSQIDSSAKASQLIKVLSPYSSITIGNNNQAIDTGFTKNSSITGIKCFPEEAMVDLIKLVHANPNSKVFLAKEFMEYYKKSKSPETSVCQITKKSIVEKIMEISDYKKTEELKDKKYWVVKPEILEKYKVTPTLPNIWSYILYSPFTVEERSVSPLEYKLPKPASLITNFTKILSQKERKNIMVKPAKLVTSKIVLTNKKTTLTTSSMTPNANRKLTTKTTPKNNPISIRKTTKGTRIKGGKLISFSPQRSSSEKKISPGMPISQNIQHEEPMNVECITLE